MAKAENTECEQRYFPYIRHMGFLNFKKKTVQLKILVAKEEREYFQTIISRLVPFKQEKGKLAKRHVAY